MRPTNCLREKGNPTVVVVDFEVDDGGMVEDGEEERVGDELEGECEGVEI